MAYTPRNRRDFYVSATGNDSSDGLSPTRPWLTVAKVNAAALQGGDTIHFEGGSSFLGPIIPKAGAAGNPIVYTSYGIGRAKIVGDNERGVLAQNVGNLIIANLIFQGINQSTTTWAKDGISVDVGYLSNAAISNIAIINCRSYGFAGFGIGFYSANASSTISNVLIEGCIAHNNMQGIYIYRADTGTTNVHSNVTIRNCKAYNNAGITGVNYEHTGSGIIVSGTNTALVENCEAYSNGAKNGWPSGGPVGIWCYDSNNVTIRNCESHNNLTGVGSARKDGGGFNIDGGCQNCVIERCYAHDNAGAGFALFEYGSARAAYTGNVIRNCVGIGNGKLNNDAEVAIWSLEAGFANNRIHNNLFISNGTVTAGSPACVNFVTGTVALGQLNIFNNIFIADGSNTKILNGTVQGTWSNNYFHTLNGASANYGTGGTVGDPLLRNYSKFPPTVSMPNDADFSGYLQDYKLTAASGCVNTGLGTLVGYTFPTVDFWGGNTPEGTINIGPHELVT